MATCPKCGKSGFGIFEIKNSECPACRKEKEQALTEEANKKDELDRKFKESAQIKAESILITTETFVGENVERLGIVAGEAVFGMGLFKDIGVNFRDIVGGRSKIVQNTLREAREVALSEMKVSAAEDGADAVIAVDINYHSISTSNSMNMMIVACTGTSIKWKNP